MRWRVLLRRRIGAHGIKGQGGQGLEFRQWFGADGFKDGTAKIWNYDGASVLTATNDKRPIFEVLISKVALLRSLGGFEEATANEGCRRPFS